MEDPNEVSLSRINIATRERGEDYGTPEGILSFLESLEVKHNLPVLDVLRVARRGDVDSLSLTHDNPYHYIYFRLDGEAVFIRVKELDKEMEFQLPCDTLSNDRSLNTKSLNAPTHLSKHERTMDSKRLTLEQTLVEWRDIKPTKKTHEIAEEWRNLGRHVKRRR